MTKTSSLNRDQIGKLEEKAVNASAHKQTEQLYYYSLGKLVPNRNNARGILPSDIHSDFFKLRATVMEPQDAMGRFIEKVLKEAAHDKRVYSSVWDLAYLVEVDEKQELSDKLLPLERRLRDLAVLALTIQEQGVLNPLLVTALPDDEAMRFKIIAGNRRFWACVLLENFMPNTKGRMRIPCRIMNDSQMADYDQSVENTARSNLNAIALVRQIALLLYAANDMDIPDDIHDKAFYEQAFRLDLRNQRANSQAKKIYSSLGLSKERFSQIKSLLQLPVHVMEFSDDHELPEYALRELVSLSREEQDMIVKDAKNGNWSSRKIVAEILGYRRSASSEGDSNKAFAAKIRKLYDYKAKDVAAFLLKGEGSSKSALSRLDSLRKFLDEVEDYLSSSDAKGALS
jgi:ParB-like chromosome segregation protein Spo0J